jgi:hypothetical protein
MLRRKAQVSKRTKSLGNLYMVTQNRHIHTLFAQELRSFTYFKQASPTPTTVCYVGSYCTLAMHQRSIHVTEGSSTKISVSKPSRSRRPHHADPDGRTTQIPTAAPSRSRRPHHADPDGRLLLETATSYPFDGNNFCCL